VGGHVLRRNRSEGKAVHFDHDIGAFQPEIKEHDPGPARAGGEVRLLTPLARQTPQARLAQSGHLPIAAQAV